MEQKTQNQRLKSNIWKFYLYRIFSCIIFVSPIFILFYQENGLSMTQIMILQSVYTATIILAILPSGIVADHIGRKKVLIANAFFYTLGWLIYSLSYNFAQFIFGEIAIGLSSAMWMASGSAFVYDTLKEIGKEGSFKKLYGNIVSINYIFFALSSLFAGYIAKISLRTTFWLTIIPTFIAFLIAFTFKDPKKHKNIEINYLKHLKNAAKFAAGHPKIRMFILHSTVIFALGIIGYVFYQPYLKSINVPLAYFGLVYFLMFLAAATGSRLAYRTEQILGEKKILII